MLNFFPTPYPEELWFSTLCRYHIRTGGFSNVSTFSDLIDLPHPCGLGALYPNGTLKRILDKLPKDLFSSNDIILHHTLFPYFMRMRQFEDKESAKTKIINGASASSYSIWKSSHYKIWRLSYCPVCVQEDKEKYGEAYWHVPHQIPLIPLCHKHYHPLVRSNYDADFLNYSFCPMPSEIADADSQPSSDEKQILLTDILTSYWSLPLSVGPTRGHNNLIIALADLGYARRRKNAKPSMDVDKLFHDLTSIFGQALVSEIYGENPSPVVVNRLARWAIVAPERYALLQAFVGMSSEEFFSKTKKEEHIKTELLRMQQAGVAYSKTAVAERLGISIFRLDSYMKQLGIEAFWGTNMYAKSRAEGKALLASRMYISEHELKQLTAVRDKIGFQYTGHFLWYCYQDFLKNHPEYMGNDI